MFAERLRQARKRKGITQRTLAQELGITYSEVSNYENRKREPGLKKLVGIALTLGVTTDYLLGLTDKSNCC